MYGQRCQTKMNERKFNLMLSMAACFLAVEAGALVVCIGMTILDGDPFAGFQGVALWAYAQPVILLIALGSMPLGALLRMVLGLAFERPRPVALAAGGLVGLCASAFVVLGLDDGLVVWIPLTTIGLVAGVVGGWTWWRVEKTFLDRQELSYSEDE